MLVEEIRENNKRQIGKAMSLVESGNPEGLRIIEELEPYTGNAYIIGITGAPGAGKSTLTTRLAQEYRKQGKKVGILAIDPSSPFSGGAILGDRIRMNSIVLDPGVFIRSMSTRGFLGGLAQHTNQCARILDAAGYEIILIETVGVGQSEVDIVRYADTVLVVTIPGMGDDIQAIKAGILEIADLFVINKADHDGVDKLKIELQQMLNLDGKQRYWDTPIVETIAPTNSGIAQLVEEIGKHVAFLGEENRLRGKQRKRLVNELEELIHQRIYGLLKEEIASDTVQKSIDAACDKKESIYELARNLVDHVLRQSQTTTNN